MNDAAMPANENLESKRTESVAGVLHTIVVLLALTTACYLGYRSVAQQHGIQQSNRNSFYLLTMAWEWLLVAFIFWGVRRHGGSIRRLVGGAWKRGVDVLVDIGVAFAFWCVALIVLTGTARVLHTSGLNEAARSLAPHGYLQSFLWILLASTAGFCEETIFRGYLQRQFAAWTRNVSAGVVISALLFGAGHIYQGVRPAALIAVFGLLFGILAEMRRSLRPGMMAHAWQDAIGGFFIRFAPRH